MTVKDVARMSRPQWRLGRRCVLSRGRVCRVLRLLAARSRGRVSMRGGLDLLMDVRPPDRAVFRAECAPSHQDQRWALAARLLHDRHRA